MTRLVDLATTSIALSETSSRSAKSKILASVLRAADREDIPTVVAWLSGDLLQRRIGVGWAALATLPSATLSPNLTVHEVNQAFIEMGVASGPGSQTHRAELLERVLGAATEIEQTFLRNLLSGGLRQGALAGVMTDAIAHAAGVAVSDVRRAAMLQGDLPTVAAAAMRGGKEALATVQLEVGRGVLPMLAETATSVDDALERIEGDVAFEAKLDGARIQVHLREGKVSFFTRSLDDITQRLPELAEKVKGWPAHTVVADGEIMAVGDDARPRPFQETASRFGQKTEPRAERAPRGLRIFLFDLLHHDGRQLLDLPASERRAALERLVPPEDRVERIVTRDPKLAKEFYERMVREGFEGVIAKSISAPYEAGRRGASWLKIKPVHTLDLVVLAVEWGSGRRKGKLSNIHLGARDPKGGFVMLGKTFKGMTDAMLDWQTTRFRELAEGSTDGYVVKLRPEQVVEIAFDGIQTSSRYPGKMALRFARVLRYREDKPAGEADTIDTVRAMKLRGASGE